MSAAIGAWFANLHAWLFETVVQPLAYHLGPFEFMDEAFAGTEIFLLGALQITVLYLILRPFETINPAEHWTDRRAVRVDVLYTLVHRLGLFSLVLFLLLDPWIDELAGWFRLQGGRTFNLDDLWPGVTSLPWVALLLYLIVIDLAQYWVHRWQHRYNWWWALHSLHHSQQQMSLWSDNRNHLLDDLLRDLFFALIALIIGVAPGQFVLLLLLASSIESLQHANIRLSFGPVGERLLVSPRFHRRHHAVAYGHEGTKRGCNFAVLFPIWDMLFGTADFSPGYPATGIRDQLPAPQGQAREYGRGFADQQWRGLQRLARALRRDQDAARTV